jgi:hypothetical protein
MSSYRAVPNINLDEEPSNIKQEITIDCENSVNNNEAIRINNGSSNITNENNNGLPISNSTHTLFEASTDNSYRVVRSYREYAAEFVNSDDSDASIEKSSITSSDDTSVNESNFVQTKKNTFDLYRNRSGSNLKNIVYDIEKSKTIESAKSSSTSSSKTATYKNPTLYSVVNQTYIYSNSSIDKSSYDQNSSIDELKKEKLSAQLKLQKMILNVPESYDIPTHNKKILSQRILNATLIIMIIIATSLLALYIYLKLNHGYSYPHLKDINDNNRTKIIFISLFMYLGVIIGSVGSALNWKSILLTYSIFCSLNALALGYLVYGVYDDAYRFTNLPLAWWDTYSSNTRKNIQDEFACCGFKSPLDGGEISNHCAKEAVVWNIPYELIYDNFKLLRKDNCGNDLNVTVIMKKNKNKTDTAVQQPLSSVIDTNFSVTEVNSSSQTTTTTSETTTTRSSATTITTTSRRSTARSSIIPSTTQRGTTSKRATPTSSSSPDDTSSSTTTAAASRTSSRAAKTTESSSNHSKRAIKISYNNNNDNDDEESMEILHSPYAKFNIYNILSAEEVEEENDSRNDNEISNIRILNKRVYIQESTDEYQLRTNATNPEINFEKIKASNYTRLTPEESKAYSKANGLEGCEMKLHEYINKNLVPVFYVLLVFFCLYIITIPVALIFLFKLRRIPSINEFE